jgi:Tfp pilus assembly protein PilP
MLWRTLLVIVILSLTGCVTGISNCATVFNYTAEQQRRAADELDALPADSVLATMISDYGVIRAEARACRGAS